MESDVLETNLLAIAGAGLMVLLTGFLLYLFRSEVFERVRFFLPIPPLGVASYIFVFNLYRHYDGGLPDGAWNVVKEVLTMTAVAAVSFGIFTVALVAIISIIKR